MRLVEPWIKVENFDGVKIMKRIERACRTCYRSEDKISDLLNISRTYLQKIKASCIVKSWIELEKYVKE